MTTYPNGVARGVAGEWPLGQSSSDAAAKRSQSRWDWVSKWAVTQGGSFLATLGFGSKSPWDLTWSKLGDGLARAD